MSNEKEFNADFLDLDEFIQLPEKKPVDTGDPAVRGIYEKNLNALGTHHPELIDLLESLDANEERIELLHSESGHPRIVYKKDDGEQVNIHSAHSPVDCANEAINLLGKMEKEGIIVLFGFGLGYFAEEIYKRLEKGHIILVYEATPLLFKTAMQIKDLSEVFKSDKVKVVIGEKADNFSVIHSHHHLIANGKFWIINHHPSVSLNKEAYDRFSKRLEEEKRITDAAVATVIGRGKEFIDAFLQCVPFSLRKPGVTGLKDLFKGRPSIVVSAGPSLDKNLHLLKQAKGKAIIIAVDGALPTLLSCDIVPDMIVAVDPVQDNIDDKFRDNPELEKVPFICLYQYTPEMISIYPGPLFINGVPGNIAYIWLLDALGDRGYIEAFGGSVAHLAFATAEYVGSDVIALIGQDLSFKEDRAHTKGYSDTLDSVMKKNRSDGLKERDGFLPVTDMFGEDAYTILQFLSFKTSIENRIRQFNRTIINSTEGGLLIEGAVNMRLADFISEYCINLDEIDTFSILSALADNDMDCDLDTLIRTVKETRDIFNKTGSRSKTILKYIKKLKKIKNRRQKDFPEFHNIIKKVEMLYEKIRNPVLNLLAHYHYGLELYLQKQDVQDIDEIEDEWERHDKQVERGEHYYTELIEAIRLFNKQLDKLIHALKREKKVDMILANGKIKKQEKYFKAGMIYKDAESVTMAVNYLEKAIEAEREVQNTGQDTKDTADSGLQSLYISLAEMYMKQFRYYKALEILQTVTAMGAEATDHGGYVKKLLRTCNGKISQWHDRKRDMKKSLKEAEENYGSDLESGYFYFRIKDFERAEKAYLKAVGNEESGDRSQESDVAAYYGLAHTYLAMNDPEKAVGALEKAIETDPSNPILYRDMGLIAIQNNNVEPAEIFLSKAIELAPGEAELYRPLAGLYMSLGEREKAVTLYENALQANADNQLIRKGLAEIYKETITEAEGC